MTLVPSTDTRFILVFPNFDSPEVIVFSKTGEKTSPVDWISGKPFNEHTVEEEILPEIEHWIGEPSGFSKCCLFVGQVKG